MAGCAGGALVLLECHLFEYAHTQAEWVEQFLRRGQGWVALAIFDTVDYAHGDPGQFAHFAQGQ